MQRKIKWEDIIVLLVAATVILGIVIYTGSLFSGYHLVDDNFAYIYKEQIENSGLLNTILYWIKADLGWRFRPLYKLEQVLLAAIFGTNLNWWMLWTALKGVAASLFLWKFARNCSLNRYFSAFFVGVCLLGVQFIVWIRQGNQENTGMLLLAITLYLLVKEAKIRLLRNRKKWMSLLLGSFVLLTSLEKESFVIMIPAYILLSMTFAFDVSIMGTNVKSVSIKEVKNVWKSGMSQYIVWLAIMCTELVTIVFFIGTNENKYAGFSRKTKILEYVDGVWKSLRYYCDEITCLMIMFLIYQIIVNRKALYHLVKRNAGYWLTGFYIISSQLVLHAKSAMYGRYAIPFVVGIAILCVIVVAKEFEMREGEKTDIKAEWICQMYIGVLIVYLFCGLGESINQAKAWTESSAETSEGVLTIAESFTGEGDPILLISGDPEHANCLEDWLTARGREVFRYSEEEEYNYFDYKIILIEKGNRKRDELAEAVNWQDYNEVYNNNGFLIWQCR